MSDETTERAVISADQQRRAIWLAAGGALILGPPLGSAFQRGPWHLGRWSRPIGIIACVWVVFITVLFMLPTVNPINWDNFNYTVFAVVAVIGFAGIHRLVAARDWFTGPKVQGTPEELAAAEAELEALA